MKERLKQYIENIKQLSIEAHDEDNYNIVRAELENIITWSNMAIVLVNRLKREEESK